MSVLAAAAVGVGRGGSFKQDLRGEGKKALTHDDLGKVWKPNSLFPRPSTYIRRQYDDDFLLVFFLRET